MSDQTEAEKKAAEDAAAREAAEKEAADKAAKEAAEKAERDAAKKATAKKPAAPAPKTAAPKPAEGEKEPGTRRLLLKRTDKQDWTSYLSDFGGVPGWNDDVEKARIITSVEEAHELLDLYEGDGSTLKVVKAPT